MNNILLKLFIAATLTQTGVVLNDFFQTSDKQSLSKLKTAQAKILKIDWKPISVFPEESRKFQSK